jgi:hypothetical protein
MEPAPIENRIKLASRLVGVGLLVQALSFTVLHPLAFMAFLTIGCPLVFAGIGLYLLALLKVS